jgi:hypothetical protein
MPYGKLGVLDMHRTRLENVALLATRLLAQLGAGPGGPAKAVVTDVREEMVAYIAGRPYLRRELEMPAAAFHHAGVHRQVACDAIRHPSVMLPYSDKAT